MKCISLINQKGGVAKTTSTYNLAAAKALDLSDGKILMVDLDPQASLTIAAGIEPGEERLEGHSTCDLFDTQMDPLEYLNDGYEWVVDIDIEQFFDKVNHDKLIQILREQVNDSTTLNLIRKYLKAGVMENGLEKATITGVPQGGPLSVVCSNVYLDKLDKELEHRGLRFTRYADDVLIFTKSEMAANRVMNSISDWLERKLFLKVNAAKTKVVRPMRSKYLGFTFLKNGGEWTVKPTNEKKKKLKKKLSEYLKRGKAIARPLVVTIKRVNEIVRGWINYFRMICRSEFLSKSNPILSHSRSLASYISSIVASKNSSSGIISSKGFPSTPRLISPVIRS